MSALLLLLAVGVLVLATALRPRSSRAPHAPRPSDRLQRYLNALPLAPDYTETDHLRREIAGIARKRALAVRERRDAMRARRQAEPAPAPTNVAPMPKRRRA